MKDWDYPFERPHSWDIRDERWYIRYLELKKYKEEFGHCRVPKAWSSNPALASWVNLQRRNEVKIPTWRKDLLNKLEFTWRIVPPLKIPPKSWDEHYEALIAFYQRFGHSRVPHGWTENKRLSNWVQAQRLAYKKGELSSDKVKRLQTVGFKWVLQVQEVLPWENYYKRLLIFRQQYGHCNVPGNYQDKKLAQWVMRQRKISDSVPQERKKLLNDIGFVWRLRKKWPSWEERFEELLLFKAQHGHCNVPRPAPEIWKGLATWVAEQRRKYKEHLLTETQVEQLNNAGFSWTPISDAWMKSYEELALFKDSHGHTRPSSKQTSLESLGNWVLRQRKKKSKLSADQVNLLDLLGFEWVVTTGDSPSKQQKEQKRWGAIWLQTYEALKKYQMTQGHCNVSVHDKAHPGLGQWVIKQRIYFKKGTLSQNRIDLLNSLGFEWDRKGKRTKHPKK